ncbi:uncharacterized protein LOC127835341 [Dreissena polymorpha]|uniref:Uncharacterized protein n=1 Tax=Dreissena polymorpha TaxID=45954 RepID=A0A9D4GAD2_DREPO|nr:uncharacterized protein LOC127835341 [Dreissena polymorpha]KAH3811979.1 hypothetical protein DPMN_140398 [Dreissena polymorpha]
MADTITCAVLIVFLVYGSNCGSIDRREVPSFSNGQIVGTVGSHHIVEASGLAASRKNPGLLYTHNDHGYDAEIFVITTTGHRQSTITLAGITHNDLEDIALGPCAAGSADDCLYIGDIGNAGGHARNNVYRIREPSDLRHDTTIHVSDGDKLEFKWNETDCETLMVDPNANLYIISKAPNGRGIIAQLPTSAWGTGTRVAISSTAYLNIDSTHNDPVGGDISPSGNRVLLQAQESVYYWDIKAEHDYLSVLQTPGVKLPYIREPKAQSICWSADEHGYYTLGEGQDQPLYLYTMTESPIVG